MSAIADANSERKRDLRSLLSSAKKISVFENNIEAKKTTFKYT